MKSISLILSATVFFSATLSAQENYSLWPRRPVELEQAQVLLRKKEYGEMLKCLAPFIYKSGPAGHEARRMVSAVRVPRYLTAAHPRAHTHTVRRGDNIERIANTCKMSSDLLVLVNAMLEPSALRVGQKLTVFTQDLRAELHVAAHELTVWDGRDLVAAYDVSPSSDLAAGANTETRVRDREGELHGARVPRSSALYTTANRLLRLADGTLITGGDTAGKPRMVKMQQKDVNELSLLLGAGARVSIVREEKSFDPFPGTSTPTEANN